MLATSRLPAQRPQPHIAMLTLLLLQQLNPAMRWRQAGKLATEAASCMVTGSGVVAGRRELHGVNVVAGKGLLSRPSRYRQACPAGRNNSQQSHLAF